MDQILPFFIAEVGAAVPGIAGVFVAGIFSAALRLILLLKWNNNCSVFVLQHSVDCFELDVLCFSQRHS
jgi:hypothetical protein